MMKVVFEATPILPKPSGVGLLVLNLLVALESLQTVENFELVGISYHPSFKNWLRGNLSMPEPVAQCSKTCMLPLPVRLLNVMALIPNNPVLERLERRFGAPDIYHGTNFAVYPCRHSLRVMNIYDLSFMRHPDYVTSIVRTYAQRVRQCLEWTDLVITISESSKQDIVEYLNVSPERVWVTPLASRYGGGTLMPEKLPRPKVLGDRPYILFVSTLEPRKNIVTLIRAFDLFKASGSMDHQLILIGKQGWNFSPILRAIEASPWRDQIHHLGYLSDADVAASYAHADVFAYPSYYEGFGLPVLEAMTLGCPVVTSNTSSLPEVAGEAALLIDPNSAEDLAAALEQVICDRTLRQSLIDKGYRQAAQFSWTRTAKSTLDAYRSIL
jgi:glycosyltransferase involved in cell wall biosynthesis